MHLTDLSLETVAYLPYVNAVAPSRPGRSRLPLRLGTVCGLPDTIDGLIVTADLQGRMPDDRLVGEAVPGWLAGLALQGTVAPLKRMGACLRGDLFPKPGGMKRGGRGDVHAVWSAFDEACHWVTGVSGNHDLYGDPPRYSVARPSALDLLDGTMAAIDELAVAGVGGIIGDPAKPHCRSVGDYLAALDKVPAMKPDLLLLHDGPDDPVLGQRGVPAIRERLTRYPHPILVCRGHSTWKVPFVRLTDTCQILNVEASVVVLQRVD